MINISNVQVFSKNPLWVFYDEPQPVYNTYSDLDIIRVIKVDGSVLDVPIIGSYIPVPAVGMMFFRTQEDAIRLQAMQDDSTTAKEMLKNSQIKALRSKTIIGMSGGCDFNPGLYTIQELDDQCACSELFKYAYLKPDGHIRRIGPANTKPILTDHINDYLKRVNITNVDTTVERLIFEVLYENGKAYIRHFGLQATREQTTPLLYTPLNDFILFTSVRSAQIFRYLYSAKTDPNDLVATAIINNINKTGDMYRKQNADASIVNAYNSALDTILSGFKLGDKLADIGSKKITSAYGKYKEKSKNKGPNVHVRDTKKPMMDPSAIIF